MREFRAPQRWALLQSRANLLHRAEAAAATALVVSDGGWVGAMDRMDVLDALDG